MSLQQPNPMEFVLVVAMGGPLLVAAGTVAVFALKDALERFVARVWR